MGWLIGLPLGLLRLLGGLLMLVLRLAWPVLLGAAAVKLVKKLRGGPAQKRDTRQEAPKGPSFHGPVYTVHYEDVEEPAVSAQPDSPVPFGYKTGWLAVRCMDPQQLLLALDALDIRLAGWSGGLACAGERGQVFVSPMLDGLCLAVGLPELGDHPELLERLAEQFREVQYFSTHRVVEYHAWLKYEDGRLTRDYCYCGEQGAVLRDAGELTREESALGFGRFPRKGREAVCEDFPDEEDVLNIAAAWGIDPRFEKKTYPPSVGWLCTMP